MKFAGQNKSQTRKKVTGVVRDQNGEPIIGANVVEKGTTNGTITDVDGRFSLEVYSKGTLLVSYIGFTSRELIIGNQSNIEIQLKEDMEALDEVVVIGYGTAKKKDLTGAVAAVKGDDLAARKTTQLSTALQGAASGVTVTRDNSAPGATASIQIRGVTTIGETSPLVIVDGIPGDINQVNPEDVESMSVLKDAASASIYGSRAAAGVILVSTKSAKNNQLKMSYNYEYGIDMPTAMPKYARARDWMIFKNELTYNDGGDDLYGVYSQDFIDSYEANHAIDPDRYPITDWQDVLLKDQSNHQRHSFTLSGGTDKLLTNFSLNYYKGYSIIPGKEYERIYARLNNDFKINNWIHAKVDLNVRLTDREYPNSPIYYTHHSHPLTTNFWSNGLISQGRDCENPYVLLTLAG